MRTDVWRDARPSWLAESVMRITCISCAVTFTSKPYREGGGVAAQTDLMEQWRDHLEKA